MASDSVKYVQALQRTIEFEEELAEKFGGSGNTEKVISNTVELDKGENSNQTNQTVMDIRKKYEKKLAAHQGNEDYVCNTGCLIYILHFISHYNLQFLFLFGVMFNSLMSG